MTDGRQSGAQLNERLWSLFLLDEVDENIIEHADLLFIETVGY